MNTQAGHLCGTVITVAMDMGVQPILDNISWNNISRVVVMDKDKYVEGIVSTLDVLKHFLNSG